MKPISLVLLVAVGLIVQNLAVAEVAIRMAEDATARNCDKVGQHILRDGRVIVCVLALDPAKGRKE